MTPVIFNESSREDLKDIAQFIYKDNPSRAYSFTAELEDICNTLSQFPNRGRKIAENKGDIRFILHKKDYLILYRVTENTITILRIFHGARDLRSLFLDES